MRFWETNPEATKPAPDFGPNLQPIDASPNLSIGEAVNLGDASQASFKATLPNLFNLGKDKKISKKKSPNNTIPKTRLEIRKSKISTTPKSILKDSTNIQTPPAPLLTHISETRPGKENLSEAILPPLEPTNSAPSIHRESISSTHFDLASNDNEQLQSHPDTLEHSPREDPSSDSSLIRTLLRDSEPPDSQIGDGDSLMGGIEPGGTRDDHNSQNSE